MVNKAARALGLRAAKSLAKATQLSKQWIWLCSIRMWALSHHAAEVGWLAPILSPLQTPTVFGGQVTNLISAEGIWAGWWLQSSFSGAGGHVTGSWLCKCKCQKRGKKTPNNTQKTHCFSIVSTYFKRNHCTPDFKNAFWVYATTYECPADSCNVGWGQMVSGSSVQTMGRIIRRSPLLPGILQLILHGLLSLVNHYVRPFHTSLCINHQDLVKMQILV